jgi:uncharacterized repeat protein (TIGR03803 family)
MRSRLQFSKLFAITGSAAIVAAAVVASPRTASAQPAFQLLHSFGPDALQQETVASSLIQATDGDFYGTTYGHVAGGGGTVYKMTPGGAFTILHTFAGGTMDGNDPSAALIQASDGNFYGTTVFGGAFDSGTVFEMTPDGTVAVLHSFAGGTMDGGFPTAALIQASDGNFYGTTVGGGAFNRGTVFNMTPGGIVTVLHAFAGGTADGLDPGAALIQATDGNFYGTTFGGGSVSGSGTVFKMTSTGTVTVLHAFGVSPNGPRTALIQATDGNFYGTALYALAPLGGFVFKMTPTGAFTVLHSFADGAANVFHSSNGELIQASDGKFYGITALGGAFNHGTVFEMTPAGAITVVHAFAGGTMDGAYPSAALIQGRDGSLYGTIGSGGAHGLGGVFRLGTGARAGGPADFDSNGQADPAVYRRSTGEWFILHSSTTYTTGTVISWGNSTDVAVPGDYDGDGTTDIAVYRPSTSTWYIVNSSTGTGVSIQWGNSLDDRPVSRDFDGDGKSDIAVYRPSTGTWFILYSRTGRVGSVQWGNGADDPVTGDFDGDGKADIAVYRRSTGTWYILYSSTGTAVSVQWGNSGDDRPVSGDFDGDGKTDIAVYRPSTSTWYILYSRTGVGGSVQWGNSGDDRPVSGDFDGDGKTDIAVYRPSTSTWYILYSRTGRVVSVQWGNSGDDRPVNEDFERD